MNKGHDNITMEMAEATYPLMSMSSDEMEYNLLHGYALQQSVCYARDNITVLGKNRETNFVVYTYGNVITGMELEVRSVDGERLIEHSEITEYEEGAGTIFGTISLKDLIKENTEYSLEITLNRLDQEPIYFYTYVLWSDGLYFKEKSDFILDFHNKTLDKELARQITKYLETDSSLESNTSFYKVNIHSSFKQITYGELEISREGNPLLTLKDIDGDTASFKVEFELTSGVGSNKVYYQVEEYYRVRYTKERIYLLDYERRMEQRPNLEQMCSNDKLVLGIVDENVTMRESEDGNTVAFVVADQLLCYNVSNNKLARVFSFYDDENDDARTRYRSQGIRILDIDEGGNITFAVYGYMNRGRHEGEIGVEIYHYDGALNTIEELLYIPYDKSFPMLMAEMDRFLFLNREQHMYLTLNDYVYCVDLQERTAEIENNIIQQDEMQASKNCRVLATYDGSDLTDVLQSSGTSGWRKSIVLHNLYTESKMTIKAGYGEAIRILGFMDDDLIYGIGHLDNVANDQAGRMVLPMDRIRICNENGVLQKEYSREGFYITDISIVDNQITINRASISGTGDLVEETADHITTTTEKMESKNVVAATDIDIFERYVQIKTRGNINTKSLKIVTPKEVVYEGGRSILLEKLPEIPRYYVYNSYGIVGISKSPAEAVILADDTAGRVIDGRGNTIWKKTTRVARNQIMAISENMVTEEKNSLVICLDTILKYQGIIRNSEYLLAKGQSVMDILGNNLENATILDLSGCSLNSVLYYVNKDLPVMALLKNGDAVLITGFNEYNIVVMDPLTGTLYKMGLGDSAEWFESNGNQFLTYITEEKM